MATYSKTILSASTDGRGIAVASTTSGSGTTIHTGSSVATTLDEIWLYAVNQDAADVKLTLEWGGAGLADPIEVTITAEAGLVLVAPGLLIKGNSSTALIVKAFASVTNDILIHGYVNQITA
jgi:hypothetical protein